MKHQSLVLQQYIIEALTQSNIVNLDGLKEIYPEAEKARQQSEPDSQEAE